MTDSTYFFNFLLMPPLHEDGVLLSCYSELHNLHTLFKDNHKINAVYMLNQYYHNSVDITGIHSVNIEIIADNDIYHAKIPNLDNFINGRFDSTLDKLAFVIVNNISKDNSIESNRLSSQSGEDVTHLNSSNPILFTSESIKIYLDITGIVCMDLFQTTCDFIFNDTQDYGKVDLDILFHLLQSFTSNDEYEKITQIISYMNYYLDRGGNEINEVFLSIPRVNVSIEYIMAYILERRKDTHRYFNFIMNNDLHFIFISSLQVLYISKFEFYDDDISEEKLINKQNIIIDNTSNEDLYRSIVKYSNIIVYLPIHKSMKNNKNGIFKNISNQDSSLALKYPSFKRYTKYYDGIINSSLRNGLNFNAINPDIEEIFKALNSTIRRRYHLYRGIDFDLSFLTKSNDRVMDKAFMSKTYLPNIAETFSGDFCCIICFIYKYSSPLLDISSVSYFPHEAEVLTFPGEIYNIISKKQCYISGSSLTLYFVEVVGNYYENNFDNLMKMTKYQPMYDIYANIITNCLRKHINYNIQDLPYFDGIVYLITKNYTYIFSQSKIRTLADRENPDRVKLDFDLDFGNILKNIMSESTYELGEIDMLKIPFGTYKYHGEVNGFIIDDSIDLTAMDLGTQILYLLQFDEFEIIDEDMNSYTCWKNILLTDKT